MRREIILEIPDLEEWLEGFPVGRSLVGVSGGRDSIALLHALTTSGRADLVVCHLDHMLRATSAGDATFVLEIANKWGLQAVVERQPVAEQARVARQSIEAAAREARYRFFAEQARKHGCSSIFLGHHADDQVETFLLNLFRGAGAGGLTGMAKRSVRTIDGVELHILRPFLEVWRDEICSYVEAYLLPFREDVSNADRKYTRNRVRHDLIPALKEIFGRDVRRAVWRAAEVLRANEEVIEQVSALQNAPGAKIRVTEILPLPIAIQRRILLQWLRSRGVPDVSFEDVESVRALLGGGKPAKVNLAAGIHARRRSGELFLEIPPVR